MKIACATFFQELDLFFTWYQAKPILGGEEPDTLPHLSYLRNAEKKKTRYFFILASPATPLGKALKISVLKPVPRGTPFDANGQTIGGIPL